jgi:2-polyprenyl-3-methyl-5-hydroxy-6-metoxy-1,4-benzoquinol methylase
VTDWKQRLFDSYVSSGQAARNLVERGQLRIDDYPFYKQIITRHLPVNKDISIVDLACGHGPLIFCLKHLGYQNVKGVDISSEQVALARSLGIEEVECLNMHDFMRGEQQAFDVVFLMDILEHLSKEELLDSLDQVYLSLRNNGLAIIHVPNAEGIFGMRAQYGDLTHETGFTQQSIKQGLTACGFENIKSIEDRPVIRDVKSLIRYALWHLLTAGPRLLLAAEIGITKPILSQNMLVIAQKRIP